MFWVVVGAGGGIANTSPIVLLKTNRSRMYTLSVLVGSMGICIGHESAL